MADYTIINATNAELTNVNAGGTDVAAQTISTGVTLTNSELAAVATLDGVAVMQDAASAAEKAAVADLLSGLDTGELAADGDYLVCNGTTATLSNVDGSTDIEAGKSAEVALTASELVAVIAEGVIVTHPDSDNVEKAKSSRVLTHGALPGVVT